MDLRPENRLSPKKLLHSKWTAAHPVRREKHFLITDVLRDDAGRPITCILEAVHSGRQTNLHWRELKDPTRWIAGWR